MGWIGAVQVACQVFGADDAVHHEPRVRLQRAARLFAHRPVDAVRRDRVPARDHLGLPLEHVGALHHRRLAQQAARKGGESAQTTAAYALKGLIHCAICTRKMAGERYNTGADDPKRPRHVRYRCRSRDLVPGGPHVASHPANVRIKQADVLELLADRMADLFAPAGMEGTRRALVGAASAPSLASARASQLKQRLSEAEARLGRLCDSIEAGVDPVAYAPRINAAHAEVDALTAEITVHPAAANPISPQQVEELVEEFAQASQEIFGPDAYPADLHAFFCATNLSLAFDQPGRRLDAEINLGPKGPAPHAPTALTAGGGKDRVRGGT